MGKVREPFETSIGGSCFYMCYNGAAEMFPFHSIRFLLFPDANLCEFLKSSRLLCWCCLNIN